MAWLLARENTTVAITKFDMEPPCKELSPPLEWYKEKGLMHAYGRWTRSAIDIDDRFWPKRARMKTERKSLPDWLGFCSFWGVSQAFRDCVEELEADVHEFRPVEVLRKDGSTYGQPYYALNIRRTVLGAVDWDKTDVPSKESRDIRVMLGLLNYAPGKNVSMKKSAIDDFHLWISDEVILGSVAVSDTLHNMLVKRKLMKGVVSFRVVET